MGGGGTPPPAALGPPPIGPPPPRPRIPSTWLKSAAWARARAAPASGDAGGEAAAAGGMPAPAGIMPGARLGMPGLPRLAGEPASAPPGPRALRARPPVPGPPPSPREVPLPGRPPPGNPRSRRAILRTPSLDGEFGEDWALALGASANVRIAPVDLSTHLSLQRGRAMLGHSGEGVACVRGVLDWIAAIWAGEGTSGELRASLSGQFSHH